MTRWRPPRQIRVKALGLAWRDGRLLVAEVRDDAGRLKGMRPPGGSVEFGERLDRAVLREFTEEFGLTVAVVSAPAFLENIFVHEGAPGHELIAIFDVALPDDALPGPGPITFHEDDGTPCIARWVDPATLDRPGAPALYPTGLKARLTLP